MSARAATLAVVRDALRTGDLEPLQAVLADDVRWYGSGAAGGCRSAEEAMLTLRGTLNAGMQITLRDARLTGDRAVLHVELPGPDAGEAASWFVLVLDPQGLICELQEYSSAAAVEHDLAILAGAADMAPLAVPPPAVSGLLPFVHVADVPSSVAFYAHLGFAPVKTFEADGELHWAFLQSADAKLMIARADAPIAHREQAIFFYLYAHDLTGLRDQLVARGLSPGEIVDGSPGPRHEMRVTDPDGYDLMIAQIEQDT